MSNQHCPLSESTESARPALTRKDFLSKTEPRWCIGCGTYSTFNAMTKVFVGAGLPRERIAIISGIGCSSRLPYYSNTYGFHTIHGRAPTVALGLKLARPELQVWVVTGDGDGLSIGGNHFVHLIRRNPDIKIILFNNQIYGLTKGQTSPTSAMGIKTKSTPYGSIDRPMEPIALALGAGATFVARVPDTDNALLESTMAAAAAHKGAALVEVLINCVIFNAGVFSSLTDKETRPANTVLLEAGKPMRFGKDGARGLRMRNARLEAVDVGENGVPESELLVHDPKNPNSSYAYSLAEMMGPEMPVAFGIMKAAEDYVYHPYEGKPSAEGYDKVMLGHGSWQREESGAIRPLGD